MSALTPPARAALALVVLVTVAGIGALAVLLADRWAAAEDAARAELTATAGTLAASLDPGGTQRDLERGLRSAASETGLPLVLFDARGRVVAASDPGLSGLDAALLPEADGVAPAPALLGGEEHLLALATVPGGAYRVLALRPVTEVIAPYKAAARRTVLLALLVWLVSLGGLAALVWYAGRRTTERMQGLARDLAALDPARGGDAAQLIERAGADLGRFAEPFGALAEALRTAHAETAEARSHVAALLQINPHYVLLCTLDGHIVDANPAFYAMSGLPFEAVRGNRIEVLNEVMPVEPLFELARRSARENASIGGVEYALMNRDDVRRPVQVSVRAVHVEGKEAVMIQATDVANQRNLERQVATFSDALDLMVDQRVAQLTAGNASMSRLLDEAAVIVVSFDDGGSTRRWSRAAEALTGRRLTQVPHFIAFTSVLGLSPEARTAFTEWFWSGEDGAVTLDVATGGGAPRRLLWKKATTAGAGRAERRVLVGIELSRMTALAGAAAGDGSPAFGAMELAAGV
ncbi:MAG TPA: PAS domain-containing protein [Rubricoccaceae bacterium]|nr:PAS domain-containing protein [Rubricoccaceae bacterium]